MFDDRYAFLKVRKGGKNDGNLKTLCFVKKFITKPPVIVNLIWSTKIVLLEKISGKTQRDVGDLPEADTLHRKQREKPLQSATYRKSVHL